ncbi:MAG: hypothetical protein ACRCUY_07580 [Thermoguttaceae bacterium]
MYFVITRRFRLAEMFHGAATKQKKIKPSNKFPPFLGMVPGVSGDLGREHFSVLPLPVLPHLLFCCF